MAMIKCTECGKEISSNAKRCPHCGGKTEYATEKSNRWSALFLTFVILLILVCVAIRCSKIREQRVEEWVEKTFGGRTEEIIGHYGEIAQETRDNLGRYTKELEKYD